MHLCSDIVSDRTKTSGKFSDIKAIAGNRREGARDDNPIKSQDRNTELTQFLHKPMLVAKH